MLAFIFDSVGFGEWFVLLAVVLVVVGPQKLPATARKLGSYYARLRRAADSFRRQLMEMDSEFDRAASGVGDAFKVEPDEPPPAAADAPIEVDDGAPDNPDSLEFPDNPDNPDNPESTETPDSPENPARQRPER